MSSDGPSPAVARPSVFISYASEDRGAARQLRDVLTAAGLEVWYDESELGGGDAWDQKIRRQIRDCDYFMPVISATTERRKEGYFRREWRLAVERTLDMADDVLFLVPVAVDETRESGARVPEKFQSVQWLRAPAGHRTTALDALIRRLLADEHAAAPRPPLVTRPSTRAATATVPPVANARADEPSAPPPMPPFPHAPEKGGVGHWLKFFAEVVWWAITATWLVLSRLPRWLRILFSIWLAFLLLSTCGRDSTSKSKEKENPSKSAEIDRAVNATAEQVAAAIEKSAKAQDWGRLGEEIGRRFASPLIDPNAAGKQLVLVPFAADGAEADAVRFATAVFDACSEKLGADRPADLAITRAATESTDNALTTLGRNLGAGFILGGRITTTDGKPALIVRLIKISDGTMPWHASYPVAETEAAVVGAKIAEAARTEVPSRKKR